MTVSEGLRKCRQERGISQNYLAEKLGVSRIFINALETGKRQVPLDRLIQIANVLNCSIDELVGRKETKKVVSNNPPAE